MTALGTGEGQPQRPLGYESPAARRSLIVIAVLLALHALRFGADVVSPLAAALFLSFLAFPFELWLLRRRVPEALALLFIVALALAILGGLGLMLRQSVIDLSDRLPDYLRRLSSIWGRVVTHLGPLGRELGPIGAMGHGGAGPQQGAQGGQGGGMPLAQPIASVAATTIGGVLAFLEELSLVLFYMIFMLILRRRLRSRLGEALGPERAEPAMATITEIEEKTFRYLGLRTAVCAVTGLVVWIVLAAFGVDFALLWAVLTFLAQYVPIAGPIAATAAPVLVALVQLPSPMTAAWVALALLAWHLLVGYLLEPRVFGKGMELNQLLLLFGLVFFAWLWGLVGAILAVPILMTAKIVSEHVPALRPLKLWLAEE